MDIIECCSIILTHDLYVSLCAPDLVCRVTGVSPAIGFADVRDDQKVLVAADAKRPTGVWKVRNIRIHMYINIMICV